MLIVEIGCCNVSVVDWDSVEKEEEGGSAGTTHGERGDGLQVTLIVVGEVSTVDSSCM